MTSDKSIDISQQSSGSGSLQRSMDNLIQALRPGAKNVLSSLSEYRFKHFKVGADSIREIVAKVKQEHHFLLLTGEELNVTVRYGNKSIAQFSSLEAFNLHESAVSEAVSEVIINYDIKGKRADNEDIERFIIEIALRAEIPRREYRQRVILHDNSLNNVRWKVSFSDYIMAKNISNTIAEWFEKLPEFQTNKRLLKFTRPSYVNFFMTFFSAIPIVSASSFLYAIYRVSNPNNMGFMVGWILASVFLYAITWLMVSIIKTKFEKNILCSTPLAGFVITAGDAKRNKEIEVQNDTNWKRAKRLLFYGILTTPVQLVVAIVAAYFQSKYF